MNWRFPINNGGQFHGIGDSGIDLFKGDPIKGLTREICQNSIDARVNDKIAVRVEFKSFEVDIGKLPQSNHLLEYYKQAYKFCEEQKFEKATKYFKRTIPILEQPKIQMLRISDFNTSGLIGADVAAKNFTSPWFRLVRSVGSSDKSEGSIGAFGSGKQACFSCSDIQTVFYSTLDMHGVTAYQGVSKLICFMDAEENLHSDIGYYSEENSMPIYVQFDIDENFKRNEPGTDVYITSFKSSNMEWKKELIVAVLDGFFYAVKEGHLIVEVDDVLIDSAHISNLIMTYKDDISDKTFDYYQILTDSDCAKRNFSYIEENDVEIRMLMKQDLHRRIAIIRFPGMKVFDKGNISATVPFAGVCIIRGKKISKLLGGLENIQHNAWEISRYRDEPEIQADAESKMKKIYGDIKKLFNELKGQDTEGEIDPEIGDCIPDPMSEKEETQETINDEVSVITDRKSALVKPSGDIEVSDDDGEIEMDDDESKGGTSGGVGIHTGKGYITPEPNPGSGLGEKPGRTSDPNPPAENLKTKKKAKRISASIRYIAEDIEAGKYEVYITPKADIEAGQILIFMAAETDKYKADIRSAEVNGTNLKIAENTIKDIKLSKNVKTTFHVEFDYSDICSLEVEVYEY